MEGLAPPLQCLIELQSCMRNGSPVVEGLARYVEATSGPSHAVDDFQRDVRAFLFSIEQGRDWREGLGRIKSPHRRALLEIAACGMSGQSIMAQLDDLRDELTNACDLEIRHKIEMLPLKMLIPLLIFQFPAFLVLLFGPLLRHLIEEFNR